MSNDFLNSDVADYLHGDLLVERLTDSDNLRVQGDLEKEGVFTRSRKPSLRGFFYSLVRCEEST
jgi:hypothetical protein